MSSVINTNVTAIRSQTIYNKNNDYMTVAMNRVATGMKVNSAKDNASVWGITEKMKERIRANDQANQNIQNDTALLRTAQDGFGNTLDILKTIKERAINAANDSNVSTDRSKISEEVKQLVAQIDDNAAKVKFNGRQLLNGGVESGGGTTEVSTTNATAASAVANAVTATNPQGTNSIYSITGLKTWSSTDNKFVDIDATNSNTTLNNIYDANGKALFADGDKITLSFDDNGESKSYTYTVSQASSVAIGDVFSNLVASAATSMNTNASGIFAANSALSAGDVADAYGADVKAEDAGVYFVGKDNTHKITNFGITIEAGDPKTGTEDRIKAAQDVLNPNAVMQTYGYTGDGTTMEGSNFIYHLEAQANTGAATALGVVTGANGNKTQWMDLQWSSSTATDGTQWLYDTHKGASPTTNQLTDFTISVDGKTATWKGNSTIEEINEELAKKGINLRMQIVTQTNENLYYDGEAVTKGDSDSEVAVKAGEFKTSSTAITNQTGLYFIGANGEAINSIKITGGTTSSAASGSPDDIFNSAASANAHGFYTSMKLSSSFTNDSSTTTSSTSKEAISSSSLLPQGEALQFFVGGEQNFGVNFSIGKANNQTLFGMSGDDFAKKFETKEGAEEAIGIIDNAINKVLTEQTRLGAMEARLGYTSDNIVSMNDNLNAGISAFRDTDMAKEMTEYMKYSVLSQASQYMLSQASQNAFSVLNLLQS